MRYSYSKNLSLGSFAPEHTVESTSLFEKHHMAPVCSLAHAYAVAQSLAIGTSDKTLAVPLVFRPSFNLNSAIQHRHVSLISSSPLSRLAQAKIHERQNKTTKTIYDA